MPGIRKEDTLFSPRWNMPEAEREAIVQQLFKEWGGLENVPYLRPKMLKREGWGVYRRLTSQQKELAASYRELVVM